MPVDLPDTEEHPHALRVGWSVDEAGLGLGEAAYSYGYGGTGKSVENNRYNEYGEEYGPGDIIGCYVVSLRMSCMSKMSSQYISRPCLSLAFLCQSPGGDPFSSSLSSFFLQDLESDPATLSFTKNGTDLGTAFTLDEGVQGQALFPHIATKNVVVTVNFTEVQALLIRHFFRGRSILSTNIYTPPLLVCILS